jgi:hypothetical protein
LPGPIALKGAKAAIIDVTACPNASLRGWTDTSLLGQVLCLYREGYIPLIGEVPLAEQLAVRGGGDVLILVAPLGEFDECAVRAIEAFLGRGGRVILACGREESANLSVLLGHFGMAISNVPLGRSLPDRPAEPNDLQFLNGWEVRGEGRVVATLMGRPIIVVRTVGPGSLAVIGDSRFLLNGSLEGLHDHCPGNIRLLRELVR